jgi:membrane protease subunit HflK
MPTVRFLLAGLLSLGLLFSCLVVVDHGDVAVVFRLGVPDRTLPAGIAPRLPWPLETVHFVHTGKVRRIEPSAMRMLTGDTNLVDVSLAVQYTISDPLTHTLHLSAPEATIAAQVMAVATRTVAGFAVEGLLTTERASLEHAILGGAQSSLDAMAAGVALVAVDVTDVHPPPAVVDAFNDVSSARGDAETMALSAEAYASKILPEVRGAAAAQGAAAEAAASTRLARVSGDIARFHALRAVAAKAPAATRLRLHADALGGMASRARVLVTGPDTQISITPPPLSSKTTKGASKP